MDNDESNVLPFRRPDAGGGATSTSSPPSATTEAQGPASPAILEQRELDRLAENLQELESARESNEASVAPAAPVVPTGIDGLHYSNDELERRGRLPHWTAEDDACVASEALFRKRFGFTRNRCQRFQALCLLHEDDLTVDELRLLWRNGDLTFLPDRASNTAPFAVEVFGRVLVAFCGLLITFAFVLLLRSGQHLPSLRAFGACLTTVVVSLIGIKVAHRFYIRPSEIRRRARRAQARAHVSG